MGILDSIIGGVTRNVQSSVNNAVNNAAYGATKSVTNAATKSVTEGVKKAAVNPDEAIKKITFSKNKAGGYDIFYEAKTLSPISAGDLKIIIGKSRTEALPVMRTYLRPKHEAFIHEKVSTTIAERILDDMNIK